MGQTTKVMRCLAACKHAGQDRMYGSGLRLHNQCADKNGQQVWRCTVCGKERVA